jgi:hypothetical protein
VGKDETIELRDLRSCVGLLGKLSGRLGDYLVVGALVFRYTHETDSSSGIKYRMLLPCTHEQRSFEALDQSKAGLGDTRDHMVMM